MEFRNYHWAVKQKTGNVALNIDVVGICKKIGQQKFKYIFNLRLWQNI